MFTIKQQQRRAEKQKLKTTPQLQDDRKSKHIKQPSKQPAKQQASTNVVEKKSGIFSHLTIVSPDKHIPPINSKDVHPAIVRLGYLYANGKIAGGNARCIALLTAFKEVFLNNLSNCLIGDKRLCDTGR